MLRAAQPDIDNRKLRRRVWRLTRVLGRVREFDVGLGLLDEMAAERPEIMGEVQVAKGSLADARRKKASKLDAISGGFAHKLERKLEALAGAVAGVAQIDSERPIAAQVARRRRRLLRTMQAAGTAYAPEDLHDVRIAVKRLRYSVELAAELLGCDAARLVARLRRVQTVLGRIHDLHVLEGHLRDLEDGARFDRTLAVVEAQTRTLHAQYLERRKELRRTAAESQRQFSCLRSRHHARATARQARGTGHTSSGSRH